LVQGGKRDQGVLRASVEVKESMALTEGGGKNPGRGIEMPGQGAKRCEKKKGKKMNSSVWVEEGGVVPKRTERQPLGEKSRSSFYKSGGLLAKGGWGAAAFTK